MPRITNSMLVSDYMSNMNRNLGNMSTIQNQLSSGQSIKRASENPYTATRIMQLNSEISENKQYNANIKDTSNWLDTTDTSLSQIGNVLTRIKELMVKAGNGTYGPDDEATIKNEVVAKVKQLGTTLNTSFDGNYIFGGAKSTSKPVTVDDNGNINYADKNGAPLTIDGLTTDTSSGNIKKLDAGYKQINTPLKAEISQGVTVDYNKTAVDVLEFNDSSLGSVDTKNILTTIISNLNIASDPTKTKTQQQAALSDINGVNSKSMDAIINNVLKCRADVGALQNRMESAQSTNEDQNYNMTNILSSVGDVDYAEKTMDYSVAQTVYTAALQTSSKVLSKTLLDYL